MAERFYALRHMVFMVNKTNNVRFFDCHICCPHPWLSPGTLLPALGCATQAVLPPRGSRRAAPIAWSLSFSEGLWLGRSILSRFHCDRAIPLVRFVSLLIAPRPAGSWRQKMCRSTFMVVVVMLHMHLSKNSREFPDSGEPLYWIVGRKITVC